MPARTPEEVDELFAKALNAGDLDALVALYEPGASFVGAPPNVARGREAIREAFKSVFEQESRIEMNVVRVVRSGDVAMLYNDWTMAVRGPDGETSRSGRAIEVVRQQPDGSWLFVLDDGYARG